jgi:two-component system OmpR family sensor kinase
MRIPALSFRARLTLQWTAAFSGVLALASVAIFSGVSATTYADLDQHLRTLAGTEVTSAVDGPESPPHVHELPVTAFGGGPFTQKFVQILDYGGALVAAEPASARTMPLAEPRELAQARGGDAPVSTKFVNGRPLRIVVLRTAAAGQLFTVAVGVDISNLLAGLGRVRGILAGVWFASTAITAAIGFVLASKALAPVRHITQRATEMAAGNVRQRLETSTRPDEIGRMAVALNRLVERLHVALDANRRFAADAAHELRSPMTAIAGEIEVALRRDRSEAEYREVLQLVQAQLATLSSLTSNLILLVRAQEGTALVQPAEIPLQELLDRSVAKWHGLSDRRGVTIHCTTPALLAVYGEAGLLGRVFDNVVENAIRYNRDGGRVEIRSSFNEPEDDGWQCGMVTVEVADTGPGIPPGEQEKVFERFYRLDVSRTRHTGGSGLGLAIAREVLALFRGTINVGSSSAAGTTIVLHIPGRLVDQPWTSAVAEVTDARVSSAIHIRSR